MKILVACEESQAVTKEMRRLGHEAYSCDIIDQSGGHPEWHIKHDVLPLINGRCSFKTTDGATHEIVGKWDMIVGHPPCTYMSNAGARWMYPSQGVLSEERLALAMEAKAFFLRILNADCDRICVENPRPLKVVGLPEPTQIVQPYEHGHPYSKATLLWLKNLKPLTPTEVVEKKDTWCPANTGSFSRGGCGSRGMAHTAKDRSKTFPGIARAMAEQWAGPAEEGVELWML